MVGDKREWGEHHSEIPVIYTAIGTAAVAQKPSMERTEEENTYHIADAVGKAYK